MRCGGGGGQAAEEDTSFAGLPWEIVRSRLDHRAVRAVPRALSRRGHSGRICAGNSGGPWEMSNSATGDVI